MFDSMTCCQIATMKYITCKTLIFSSASFPESFKDMYFVLGAFCTYFNATQIKRV